MASHHADALWVQFGLRREADLQKEKVRSRSDLRREDMKREDKVTNIKEPVQQYSPWVKRKGGGTLSAFRHLLCYVCLAEHSPHVSPNSEKYQQSIIQQDGNHILRG